MLFVQYSDGLFQLALGAAALAYQRMDGGGKVNLIGNIIEQEFTAAYDWQLGSALSMILMVFIILNIVVEAFSERNAKEQEVDS